MIWRKSSFGGFLNCDECVLTGLNFAEVHRYEGKNSEM